MKVCFNIIGTLFALCAVCFLFGGFVSLVFFMFNQYPPNLMLGLIGLPACFACGTIADLFFKGANQ